MYVGTLHSKDWQKSIAMQDSDRARRQYFKTFQEPRNRFQGINSASLCSLAGRYDNPLLTRLIAPIDCLKIPARRQDFYPVPSQRITIWITVLNLATSLNTKVIAKRSQNLIIKSRYRHTDGRTRVQDLQTIYKPGTQQPEQQAEFARVVSFIDQTTLQAEFFNKAQTHTDQILDSTVASRSQNSGRVQKAITFTH